jgi:hypothetical protein
MRRPAPVSFPIPSWLEQPANLLPLLIFESDVQRLLAVSRATVLGLVADGKLKAVTMPDKTHRITLASVSEYYAGLTGESIVAPMTGRIRAEAQSRP